MRPYLRNIAFAITLAGATLLTAILFTSCQPSTPPEDTETDSESITEIEIAEITYDITLEKADGSSKATLIVKLFAEDGTQVSLKPTDAEGRVSFTLPAANYTVQVESAAGDKFHYTETTLTPEVPAVTLQLCNAVSDPFSLSAPSRNSTEYVPMQAYEVGEGTYYLSLDQTDHTYVLLNPTRSGYYEITCSDGVDFAYHGMPILIYDNPRISPTDGVIKIPVEEGSIGDPAISRLVLRLNPAEGSDTTEAFLTVKYTGTLQKTPEELAEWTIIEADPKALVPYEGSTEGTLTDIDLTSPSVTESILVLGDDGYYHYGSVTGPVVFLRISSENKYTQSFAEMCETDRIRAYLYDENGQFLRKEGYSQLVLAYAEVANKDGLVPLNDQLIYVLKNAGSYMGWWNYVTGSDIFGDLVIPAEIAWMFACAYYA